MSAFKSQAQGSVSSLWKNSQDQTAAPAPLAALPLSAFEDFQLNSRFDLEKQRTLLEETLSNMKKYLLQARRSAVLARSQSISAGQRQKLCAAALQDYEVARGLLKDLWGIARTLTTVERRRVRALEGSKEWRSIFHAIKRSSTLQSVPKTFAA